MTSTKTAVKKESLPSKGNFTARLEQPKKTADDLFSGVFVEPKEKVNAEPVGIIYRTYDYSIFKKFEGNREISQSHVKRLVESIETMYLVTVAVVSEKYEVLDGAHRIEACKLSGRPVLFVMVKGYGLEEIHRYNTTTKNWVNADFVQGYIDLGYNDYQIYKNFLTTYGLGHGSTMGLLEGGAMSSNPNQNQRFKDGEFKVTHLKEAVKMATQILEISKIAMVVSKLKLHQNRGFARACVEMFKNKNYDQKMLMSKLNYQKTRLVMCSSKDEFLRLFEDIYNFKSREKIRFI